MIKVQDRACHRIGQRLTGISYRQTRRAALEARRATKKDVKQGLIGLDRASRETLRECENRRRHALQINRRWHEAEALGHVSALHAAA